MRYDENAWERFLHEFNAMWVHENRRDALSLPSMINSNTLSKITLTGIIWHADLACADAKKGQFHVISSNMLRVQRWLHCSYTPTRLVAALVFKKIRLDQRVPQQRGEPALPEFTLSEASSLADPLGAQ